MFTYVHAIYVVDVSEEFKKFNFIPFKIECE